MASKKSEKVKQKSNSFGGVVVSDARFSRLHTDPRFQRIPKGKSKVPIDDRFSGMFSDKNFAPEFSVDKRGKKVSKNKSGENLSKYYRLESESLKNNSTEVEQPSEGGNKTTSSDKIADIGATKVKKMKGKEVSNSTILRDSLGRRGPIFHVEKSEFKESEDEMEGSDSEMEDEDKSESSSSSSDDDDSDEYFEVEEEEFNQEKVETTNDITNRLAVVNLDWDQLQATDILMLLRSFCPAKGKVISVTIYPTDYGLQQMSEESVNGPFALLNSADGAGRKTEPAEDNDDSEGDEIDEEAQKKLRKYERSKLRYFFAVAVCDSKSTANAIYEACDGSEFERSSNILDLRFIPDSMIVDENRKAKDMAVEVNNEYKGLDFTTRSLQMSRVKLTWDDDEPSRVKFLRRKLTEEQIQDLNFKDYLASSSSDESEDDEFVGNVGTLTESSEIVPEAENLTAGNDGTGENGREDDCEQPGNSAAISKEEKRMKMREKYRKLLLGSGSDEKVSEKNVQKRDEELEVTFSMGLSELGEKLAKKKADQTLDKTETVYEAYLRKKKEKRRETKAKTAERKDDETDDLYDSAPVENDPFFAQDDSAFSDPFFQVDGSNDGPASAGDDVGNGAAQKQDKKGEARLKLRLQKVQEKERQEKEKAELEMLLMEENQAAVGSTQLDLKEERSVVSGKEKKGKKKIGKSQDELEDEELGIRANYDDPRFSKLFDSPLFALDPTDPQFKRSAKNLSTLAEKQRNKMKKADYYPLLEPSSALEVEKKDAEKEKVEMSMMVKSLKRKAEVRAKKISGQNKKGK